MFKIPVTESEFAAHPLLLNVGPWAHATLIQVPSEARDPNDLHEPVVNEIVAEWLEAHNAQRALQGMNPIRPNPVLHVQQILDGDEGLVFEVEAERFTYAHFAAFADPQTLTEIYFGLYMRASYRQKFSPLPQDIFREQFVPAMPADALAVGTADGKFIFVRRDKGMLLHPGHVHVLGRTFAPTDTDLSIGVAATLMKEAALPAECIEEVVWLGISDNEPYSQPIALGLVRINRTWAEVQASWPKAADPDGPVFAVEASISALKQLLGNELLTPSCRNLLSLLLKAKEHGMVWI